MGSSLPRSPATSNLQSAISTGGATPSIGGGFGTGGGFGSKTSGFGFGAFGSQAPIVGDVPHLHDVVGDRLHRIRDAFDSLSPKCRFRSFQHSMMPPAAGGISGFAAPSQSRTQQPQNATQEEWMLALQCTPFPWLVPSIACGLDGLMARKRAQVSACRRLVDRLETIRENLFGLLESEEVIAIQDETLTVARERRVALLKHRMRTDVVRLRDVPFSAKEREVQKRVAELRAKLGKADLNVVRIQAAYERWSSTRSVTFEDFPQEVEQTAARILGGFRVWIQDLTAELRALEADVARTERVRDEVRGDLLPDGGEEGVDEEEFLQSVGRHPGQLRSSLALS